ncbi:uncharacterized protein HD556DRAFT_1538591 [Suillus plorans]|uniref:Uncharacterized protein n=1 Tax=Suillus plorans TaxID=116603 RepID=A0A9P7DDZ9_9AGAM|nr:uncharacterized protein HD556DRAFT_1538591 [Suillus plorans]KAG1788648.1 hypothetical protein HD556DRAFT_1538591 [Suillus plorans]
MSITPMTSMSLTHERLHQGSCARQMLTGQGATPNDLNLITPLGSAEILYASLVGDLRYERFEACARPNYAFAKEVKSFARFRKGEMVITISEAAGDNLFKVVVSSPTTVDMTVMTPGGLAMFYPAWTLSKVAVINGHIRVDNTGGPQDNVGCMAKDETVTDRAEVHARVECMENNSKAQNYQNVLQNHNILIIATKRKKNHSLDTPAVRKGKTNGNKDAVLITQEGLWVLVAAFTIAPTQGVGASATMAQATIHPPALV